MDVPALAELRRDFTLEDPSDGAVGRDDFEEAFARLVSDGIEAGRWVVWVAEVDGEIVSHAFVGVIDKIPRRDRRVPGNRVSDERARGRNSAARAS